MDRREFTSALIGTVGARIDPALVPTEWLRNSAPTFSPVSPVVRSVGVDYNTWFRTARWSNVWGLPTIGSYDSRDVKTMEYHASILRRANVDFIMIDWSNDLNKHQNYRVFTSTIPELESATRLLFSVFNGLHNCPRACVMIGTPNDPLALSDGRLTAKANQVFEELVSPFSQLYFNYLNKPLLVVYVGTPSPFQSGLPPWRDARFEVRFMTGYITQQPRLLNGDVSRFGYWSWEDRGPQTFAVNNSHPEFMRVLPSWSPNPDPRSRGYGLWKTASREGGATFEREWKRARVIGPSIALAGFFNAWATGVQGADPDNTKDIEPSEYYGSIYMEILERNAKLFKVGL